MKSRDLILKNLNSKKPTDKKSVDIKTTRYKNKEATFMQNLKMSAAEGYIIKKSMIEEKIKKLYPNAKEIASIYEFEIRTLDPNSIKTPQKLKDIDLAIIKGEFGVAENGAIYIDEKGNRHQAIYTIVENLVILIDKNNIVDTMVQAFHKIKDLPTKNSIFISGASKTADIEQTLVIGAHGAKRVTVFLLH